jgi:ribokinase
VTARLRTRQDWPRAGGATFYTSAALAKAGHATAPLVHLGDDAAGDAFIAACRTADINTTGIMRQTRAESARCLLIYHDAGGYTCLLDPGDTTTELNPTQLGILSGAELAVISAGAPKITACVLDRLDARQRLAWIVKDDTACFPPDLCRRLSERAQFIFCNEAERHLLASTQPADQIRVETHGAAGARVISSRATQMIAAEPLDIADATGAGDTLAGGTLAHWLSGERDPPAAVSHGMAAARAVLMARAREIRALIS